MNILVTGAAGFIGFHLIKNLIKNKKNKILGLDSLNPYYNVKIKIKRLELLIMTLIITILSAMTGVFLKVL